MRVGQMCSNRSLQGKEKKERGDRHTMEEVKGRKLKSERHERKGEMWMRRQMGGGGGGGMGVQSNGTHDK